MSKLGQKLIGHRLRRGSLLKGGAVAAALVALALSGCSGGAPGVAARVGDQSITIRQLTTASDGVAEAVGPENKVDIRAVLGAMIGGEVAQQIADAHNIQIEDNTRDTSLRADPTGVMLLTNDDAREVGYDIADQSIVAASLGTQAYATAVEGIKVTLNPRYGTWENNAIQDQSSSLSEPAAAPTP